MSMVKPLNHSTKNIVLVRSTAQAAVAVAVTVGSFSDPEAARDDKKMKLGQSERGWYIGWSMTG
jgi:hypothetical protein